MSKKPIFERHLRILYIDEPYSDPAEIRQRCPDNFTLLEVHSLQEALDVLREAHIDAILLSLPESESSVSQSLIFMHRYALDYVLIVLADVEAENLAFRAVQAGAQDYLLKGCFSAGLLTRTFVNAIERHHSEQHLTKLAHYDELTKLPNRSQFIEHLSMAAARASRRQGRVSLLFIDLDAFKVINDTRGHVIGDDYLRRIAERLQTAVRASDFLARLGGDEFAVIVENQEEGVSEPLAVAQNLLASLELPIILSSGDQLSASCSIGVATMDGVKDIPNISSLMERADSAMYYAKQQGGQRFHFYDEKMAREAEQRVYLKKSLSQALASDEFQLYYQSIYYGDNYTLAGFEALLRWDDPVAGIVQPAEFIPALEEGNLMQAVGYWVLETACRQLQQWRSQQLVSESCWVSVNISSRQLSEGVILKQVTHALDATGIPPACLQLEITESLLMESEPQMRETLEQLKEMDVRIMMDNFGAGLCSMQQLKILPVDTLKIDRSFVQRYLLDASDQCMTAAIVQLAHSLNKTVVAEGVESWSVAEALADIGCDFTQGFYFSRPLPALQCMDAYIYMSGQFYSGQGYSRPILM